MRCDATRGRAVSVCACVWSCVPYACVVCVVCALAGNSTGLVLRIAGINFGLACVGCSATYRSSCSVGACNASLQLCGAGGVPSVVVVSPSIPATSWPCNISCVSATAVGSLITCSSMFPYAAGSVVVNSSGIVSSAYAWDISGAVSGPVVYSSFVSPRSCSSDGCLVTLRGQNLNASEVLVTNALGTRAIPSLSSTGDSLVVSGCVCCGCAAFVWCHCRWP